MLKPKTNFGTKGLAGGTKGLAMTDGYVCTSTFHGLRWPSHESSSDGPHIKDFWRKGPSRWHKGPSGDNAKYCTRLPGKAKLSCTGVELIDCTEAPKKNTIYHPRHSRKGVKLIDLHSNSDSSCKGVKPNERRTSTNSDSHAKASD